MFWDFFQTKVSEPDPVFETWYRNTMNRLGVQGHALRYAWTRERLDAYLAEGIPMAEALARTSMDLGHGDGRGRWVKMVYLR